MDTNDSFIDADSKSSSSNIINHTLDIIKAAFPYLDSQSQQSLDLVIKAGELFETFNTFNQESGTLTALSVRKESIDFEALLNSIRNVCNEQERKIVDMILSFITAKNLFSTYSTLASVMSSQTENNDNTGNLGGLFGMDGNPNMMELLQSFLTPDQKSTFENLNMMFNVMQ